MHADVSQAVDEILAGCDATARQMQAAVGAVMDGAADPVDVASLLTALRIKGETVDEIVGAARAMIDRAAKITSTRSGLLDTCGTGGDRLHTFNISTATAIVAAACGAPVAKHGNRSVSSSSGSADVLEALAVNINLDPPAVGRCIDEIGIGFCFAPLFHGAMKHAAPVRRQLGFRTIFNLLGPLTNPAQAPFQLLGANNVHTAELLAGALAQLGRERAVVVCGNDELDEVALWGTTTAFEVTGGDIVRHAWTAETFGLPPCSVGELRVKSAQQSAEVIRAIFAGEPGPPRDIVVANTAVALYAAGMHGELAEAAQRATTAIESGEAASTLAKLTEYCAAA